MNLTPEQLKELYEINTQIQKLTERAARILAETGGESPVAITEPSEDIGGTLTPDLPIVVYTDGACSGNPGPAGSGVVVMQEGRTIHEISQSLGDATNNIAELTAIKLALKYLGDCQDTPISIYSDSTYSINMLTKGWKAKANQELIADIKTMLSGFRRVTFRHVRGHNGDPGNERADQLAVRGAGG